MSINNVLSLGIIADNHFFYYEFQSRNSFQMYCCKFFMPMIIVSQEYDKRSSNNDSKIG